MPERTPPNQELETAPDLEGTTPDDVEAPADGMRRTPTDPPAVVATSASEQPVIAAGTGLAGFSKSNPEGGLVRDDEERWTRDLPEEEHTGD